MFKITDDDRERFASKTRLHNPDDPNSCMHWTGTTTNKGEHVFQAGGKSFGAGKFAFLMATGIDPGKRKVERICGYKRCVNPAHIALKPEPSWRD